MAVSLQQFAGRIRELARRTDRNINNTVVRAAGAVVSTVIPATPVDTGRARGNWQVSIDTPVIVARERLDQTGQGTVQEGISKASARRAGQAIYICNNVPYIGMLNAGSSRQAPAGFVELAVQAAIRNIRNARIV